MCRFQPVVTGGLLSAIAAMAGCGGVNTPPPGPLGHHFKDYLLARKSPEARAQVSRAQNDYQVAQSEFESAKADLAATRTKTKQVQQSLNIAQLQVNNAQLAAIEADKTQDASVINAKKVKVHQLRMKHRAHAAHLTMLTAKTKWLKAVTRAKHEEMYAREANFELAKARLANRENIHPPGFRLANYVNQYRDRRRRADTSRAVAKEYRADVDTTNVEWKRARADAEKSLQ